MRQMSLCTLASPSDMVPLVVGPLAHAIASLCTRLAWLVRSGCCQQHHGIFHHSGAGVYSMFSFISGPQSGDSSSAVRCKDVEIVYTDRRDAAAMCCLLHEWNEKGHKERQSMAPHGDRDGQTSDITPMWMTFLSLRLTQVSNFFTHREEKP